MELLNKSFENRGKFFEKFINDKNNEYFETRRAMIFKRGLKAIKTKDKTFFYSSECDFYGIAGGFCDAKYIDFDVKTTILNRFELKNVTDKQYEHLKKVDSFKTQIHCEAFLLIYFIEANECYLLPFKILELYNRTYKDKSSIPIDFFRKFKEKNAGFDMLVKDFDYLKTLENLSDLSGLIDMGVFT